MMQEYDIQVTLAAKDKVSKALKETTNNMGLLGKSTQMVNKLFGELPRQLSAVGRAEQIIGLHQTMQRVGHSAAFIGKEMGKLAIKAGLAGAAGAFAFKTMFLDTASQFEGFETQLTTVFGGSSEKAQKAMGWIRDFATKTPYEVAEVTDAYVRLIGQGLEPTNGMLEAAGNLAGGMNKPIVEAVEAINDAVRGENERLKEFGIVAKKTGDTIAYNFDYAGRSMRIVAKNNSRDIQDALQQIINMRFAGGMERQSKTLAGIMSNMSDMVTNFKMAFVKDSGLYDVIKGDLGVVLADVTEQWEKGGLKEKIADFGRVIVGVYFRAKKALQEAWPTLEKIGQTINNVAQYVGGWDKLILIIGGIVIASTAANFTLGIVANTLQAILNPFAPILTALVTIYAYKNAFTFFQAFAQAQGPAAKIFQILKFFAKPLTDAFGLIKSMGMGLFRIAGIVLRFIGFGNPIIGALIAIIGLGVILYNTFKPFREFVDKVALKIIDWIRSINVFGISLRDALGPLREILNKRVNPARKGGTSVVENIQYQGVLNQGTTGGYNTPNFLAGKRAGGGSVNSGMPYLVGERGPEIMVPGTAGRIFPNSMMGGGQVKHVIEISVDLSGMPKVNYEAHGAPAPVTVNVKGMGMLR